MKKIFTTVLAFHVAIFVSYSQGTNPPLPTGRLVDAGGHKLHLNVSGSGGPTVVFENGSFDFSFVWSLVQPEVAKFSRVVSYDRAGYAWSEPGPLPRTGAQLAYELHTALHNAKINGPYVLVGQSFGGFLVRVFARLYPDEVVGMVLVDVLHEDSRINMGDKIVRIREMATGRKTPSVKTNAKGKEQNASTDILGDKLEPPLDKLPQNIQKLQHWAQSRQQFIDAGKAEMDWSPEDVADLYSNRDKRSYSLGDIPLIVICRAVGGYSGPDSTELENERMRLQNELAHLSTHGKLIVDKNSGHNVHLEDPETVVMAIKEIMEK